MGRLLAAWQRRRQQTFDASMEVLAAGLARVAVQREVLPQAQGWGGRLRRWGSAAGLGAGARSAVAAAEAALARQLDAQVRDSTRLLIALHGIDGSAQGEILIRLATHFDRHLRLDEGKAALWGSVASGALLGLKADLLSGGLTLGGGLLAGGLIGALGAAGLARCVNLVRGTDLSWVSWNAAALDQLFEAALLRYLAVAHFGRGRGDWVLGESPAHWQAVVQSCVAPSRPALDALWARRDPSGDPASASALAGELAPLVTQACASMLRTLYPQWAGPLPAQSRAVGENAQPAGSASQ
jgi:hypothetical protein